MNHFQAHRSSRAFGAVLFAVCATAASAQAPPAPDAETTFNAGLVHLKEGRPEQALEEFKKAVKQNPKSPYFYKGLGLAYARLNHPKEAIEAFRKALQINPYYVDVRNDLGAALILGGKREEGRKEFMAAFNDPMNPSPELTAGNLGQAYLEEKNYTDALNWFRTSAARNKAYPAAYLGMADALMAMGRLDDAIAQLDIGFKALPDDLHLELTLGEALYRAGRFGDARPKLEHVAAKDPGGPEGLRAAELLKNFPK